jgi:uncharacterized membrane protein
MNTSMTHNHETHRQDRQEGHYKNLAQSIYLLQSLSFFFGGIPWIIALIIGYANRSQVKDTWLESHYQWQINTFWVALPLVITGVLTIAIWFGVMVLIGTVVWVIHRIAYGWIQLNNEQPVIRKNAYIIF